MLAMAMISRDWIRNKTTFTFVVCDASFGRVTETDLEGYKNSNNDNNNNNNIDTNHPINRTCVSYRLVDQ